MAQAQIDNNKIYSYAWECTICDVGTMYRNYGSAKRHCLEQHSEYGFKCSACPRFFRRVDAKHKNCTNGQLHEKMNLVGENSGTSGTQAYDGRKAFTKTIKGSVRKVPVPQPTPATRQRQLKKSRSRALRSRNPIRPLSENVRSERRSSSPSKRMSRQRQRQSYSPVERHVTTATTDHKRTDSHRKASLPSPALSSSSSSSSDTTTLSNDGGVEADVFDDVERVGQIRGDMSVSLNVGGTKFEVSQRTLQSYPSSLFGKVYTDPTTSIFIDRDCTHMRVILNYLRDHKCSTELLPREKRYLHEIKVEAMYYNLSGLVDVVDNAIKSLD